MFAASVALQETAPVCGQETPDPARGLPCVISGCQAFLHPAGGATAVVLCSPWGFEDLAARKSWRLLAEAIARAGYPCLRFDYPGTGDSLGAATDPGSTAEWSAAINAAADFVRRNTGVRRFVFVGQTLGAALAVEAAQARADVVGLHLIAPVVNGRAHVRELAATSKFVADKLGITLATSQNEALSVVGFGLSTAMVESLKAIDLTKIERLDVDDIVIYDQFDRKAPAEAVEHFRRLGVRVTLETVGPYHLMVSDPTVMQALPVAAERLVAALRATTPLLRTPSCPVLPALPNVLVGRTFREEPLRFGDGRTLFGILCRPLHARADHPVVILLNRGLHPHVGWRRGSVDHARGLAAAGFASLRIDTAGLGESEDVAGRPTNLIYSDLMLADIRAAVDMLAARGHARIILVGVCSGGYMALAAAQADPRVTDVIAVNTQRFLSNPNESFDDVIRFGLRSMRDYVGDFRSGGALRKLMQSHRRIAPALLFLAKRNVTNMFAHVPLRLRSTLFRGSMAAHVERFFATFAARGTRVSLVYSAGDPGLMELRNFFGPNGRNLPFANVAVSIIPDADHNLTSTADVTWMLDHMIAVGTSSPLSRAAKAPTLSETCAVYDGSRARPRLPAKS